MAKAEKIMTVLFTSGDVGGARALLPVIRLCEQKKIPFAVFDHGYVSNEIQPSWPTVEAKEETNYELIFQQNKISLLVFTSSVKDTIPLALARNARKNGIPVLHVLDNWGGYRRRMEMDGHPPLIPDSYAVMDDFSAVQAVNAGIPASSITVTGQPALASLSEEYKSYTLKNKHSLKKACGFTLEKPLIVFVSEPAEQDQGASVSSSTYRGYTEKTVLRLLCKMIQPYADDFEIGILPHPRENQMGLSDVWNECKGRLKGHIIRPKNGRDAILMSDGVSGMVSILLYEAWLLGKPVISIQPELRFQELRMLEKKSSIFFVDSAEKIETLTHEWLAAVDKRKSAPCKELCLHESSPENVLKIIKKINLQD
jgi:hypothetical protein